MSYRKVLSTSLGVVVLGCLTASGALAAQGTPLPGNKISQFVDPLPLLSVAGGPIETVVAGAGEITLNMLEFKANMMPSTFVPATGTYTGTWVFGYRVGPTTAPENAVGTYIGPVIVATRGNPTQVRYVNNLRANNIRWRDWIDQSLHWANPCNVPMEIVPGVGNPDLYEGPVPAVPHLHGGEDPAVTDGGPEAWFLSDEPAPDTCTPLTSQGAAYYAGTDVVGGGAHPASANESIYRYPNSQEASPLWFHDHLLGGTRINATFAGLAGAYPIIDPGLVLPAGLHPVGLQNTAPGSPVRYTVPLAIQDRMFDTNGQLFFPNVGINPEHPYWVPEFVGDTIVVNGKVWPFMEVDQQRYRFYLINGSNSRPYDMFLQDLTFVVKGPRMWVIATDGGYLDSPIIIDPNATGQ
jgi:spore coat protein A